MINKTMSVSVIGLGRVGLMTLFHLAKHKFSPLWSGYKTKSESINSQKSKLPFRNQNLMFF